MAEKHFYEQREHTKSYLIPFFQKNLPGFLTFKILEIGCAEAGFLDALQNFGIDAAGLELEAHRVKTALKKNPSLQLFVGDITHEEITNKINDSFDLIVLKDTIEHIPDRISTFKNINSLLKKNGYLYVTFPPRFSPFGGHQQNGNTILRFLPFLHLLPVKILKILGAVFKERQHVIENIIFLSREGLSIRKFEKYCVEFSLIPVVKSYYLIRPIHKTRFGLSPRKIPTMPLLSEFVTSGCEYLLQKRS